MSARVSHPRRWWSASLQQAFVLGCAVSMLASGRLSARLIADGAMSFAFVPFFQALALAVVWRTGRRPARSLRLALPEFGPGNRPWLVWIVAVTAVAALVPPRDIGPWIRPVLFSASVPIVWSVILDFHFFRDTGVQSPGGAIRDLVLHRAIAWTGAGLYFLGLAAWAEVVPRLAPWVRS